jgi:hypothetical protein
MLPVWEDAVVCAKSQYSLEKHLAMAIFMGRWREGLLGMFTTYFDASGSPDDVRTAAVVVAGFVATAEQWIEFDRNWNDALSRFHVSALHMKDYAHSRRDYADWEKDQGKRQEFLAALINIVCTRMRHSFVSAVMLDGYRRLNQKYYLEECVKPYSIAGNTCIAKVKRWADTQGIPQDQIAYFFEDGDADKGDFMQHAKRSHGFTPLFLPKTRSVAFQAADLLAYEHLLANTKIYKSGSGTVSFRELRYPLKALDKIPNGDGGEDWGVHDDELLERHCKESGIPARRIGMSFEQTVEEEHGL